MNPYLFSRSPSQLRTYCKCPRQWFLRYGPGQRWRARVKGSALVQGSVYHRMMELLTTEWVAPRKASLIDPLEYFMWLWDGVGQQLEKDEQIKYPEKDSWAKMGQRGRKFWGLYTPVLLDALCAEVPPTELPLLGPEPKRRMSERQIRFNAGWPANTIIDYAGPLLVNVENLHMPQLDKTPPHVVRALLDYKTVKYEKEPTAAEIDAQLMTGQLALRSVGVEVDVVGLLDLVVQQEKPRLQWLLRPAFDAHELAQFVSDVLTIDKQIGAGVFPMIGRFTGACEEYGGCEFKPLCFPSLRGEIATSLYQETRVEDADDLGITFGEFE